MCEGKKSGTATTRNAMVCMYVGYHATYPNHYNTKRRYAREIMQHTHPQAILCTGDDARQSTSHNLFAYINHQPQI